MRSVGGTETVVSRVIRAAFVGAFALGFALLPTLSTVQAGEAAKPRLAAEQVLRTVGSEPDTIDPQKASFTNEIDVIMKVFSNLYTYDRNGNLTPEMAAAMPEISSDGKTITARIKQGLKYSDGVSLTSKDFKYGWMRHLDPRTAGEYAFTGYDIVGAEAYNTSTSTDQATLDRLAANVGIQTPDDYTIVFQLDKPAVYFPAILATWNGIPTRKDMIDQGGSLWTEPETYIGNGPFKLTVWEHQVRMVFEANPNYWRGAPKIQRWEEVMINDATVAFTAYLNGELDIVGVGSGEIDRVRSDPQLNAQFRLEPGTCTYYLGFNTTRPPMDNLALRQAIAQAFDRETWVRDVNRGLGQVATQFVPPGIPGYYPDLKVWNYDPAAARATLQAAGIDPASLPEITYSYSSNPRNQLRAEWVQNQLQQALGLKIKLDPVEGKAYTAMLKKQDTTPQMFYLGWCMDYPDPQDWYTTVFHSSATVSHTGWKNAEFDRLTRAADGEQNPQRRNELYKQAAQILLDQSPVVFVANSVNSFLVSPKVKGWTSSPLDYYFSQSTIMDVYIAD